MSTEDEIREVYQSEIDHKTNIVRQRLGVEAFLTKDMVNGVGGYSVFEHTRAREIVCFDDFPVKKRKKGK